MVLVGSLSERIAGQHDVTFRFSKIQNGGWSFRGRDDISLKFVMAILAQYFPTFVTNMLMYFFSETIWYSLLEFEV